MFLKYYHRCLFYIFNQATMAEDREFIRDHKDESDVSFAPIFKADPTS